MNVKTFPGTKTESFIEETFEFGDIETGDGGAWASGMSIPKILTYLVKIFCIFRYLIEKSNERRSLLEYLLQILPAQEILCVPCHTESFWRLRCAIHYPQPRRRFNFAVNTFNCFNSVPCLLQGGVHERYPSENREIEFRIALRRWSKQTMHGKSKF